MRLWLECPGNEAMVRVSWERGYGFMVGVSWE